MFDKMKHQRLQKNYHIAGPNCYPKAKINKGTSERLFCLAAKARAAGWRVPE